MRRVSTLPLKEHGFDLHKGAFRDALSLRYGWRPPDLPSNCICGNSFSVDHSLTCPYGGFPTLHHNTLRDLTAILLKKVCPVVSKEPPLQPLSGETLHLKTASSDDGARLDVAAEGFWYQDQRNVFDIRVVNPYSHYQSNRSISDCYTIKENEKKRKYDERIREVKHRTFSPLVFSTSGGMGPIATRFLKRISLLYSEKHRTLYSHTINFLRCRFSFIILKSSIRCLRGSRLIFQTVNTDTVPGLGDMDRALSDGRVHLL